MERFHGSHVWGSCAVGRSQSLRWESQALRFVTVPLSEPKPRYLIGHHNQLARSEYAQSLASMQFTLTRGPAFHSRMSKLTKQSRGCWLTSMFGTNPWVVMSTAKLLKVPVERGLLQTRTSTTAPSRVPHQMPSTWAGHGNIPSNQLIHYSSRRGYASKGGVHSTGDS
jgi:hypothetical protein